MTEVFITVGNLKNNKAVGFDAVSTEVLETSFFVLIEFLCLSLSRGWFLKCLKNAKVYHSHKLGDILDINNSSLIWILPAIRKVFKKMMYEQFCS